MAFDGITVANLRRDLAEALTDSRISRIIQPEPDALLLTCKSRAGQVRLLMSASASLPLLYLTDENKTAPVTAPNFCMLLRKHIGNGRIIAVTQPSLERVIFMDIEHYDEMGDLRQKRLVIELMGKHSNIIFCDDAGVIIDSIKHISSQVSSVREVLPGRSYFIPSTQDKKDPLSTDLSVFCETVFSKPMPLSRAIYTSYTGISPVIAEEICHRAGMDSERSAGSFNAAAAEPAADQTDDAPGTAPVSSDDTRETLGLWKSFRDLMRQVREEDFSPVMVLDEQDKPVDFASVELTMYRDMKIRKGESISRVLRDFYAMKDANVRIRQKSADLRHITATAIERTSKKLDLQTRQMRDTQKMDKYRLYGEMLHTYGYDARPGDKSLTVTNYYTNEPLTIPLDPTMTAAENAKKYFDRFSKLKRTAAALTEQIAQTRADLDQLLSIRTFLDMAASEADLSQVREELVQAGYIRRRPSREKGKPRFVSKPYHYRTGDGYELFVGRNNLQNDQLTFQEASGNDWWFHAKGIPGSHVIAKSADGTLPDHVFEDAARLAAYYSAGREAGRVEIDYIQRKHVKKPGGAKPGFVVYYTNYSMVIDTDISGLQLVE